MNNLIAEGLVIGELTCIGGAVLLDVSTLAKSGLVLAGICLLALAIVVSYDRTTTSR